MTTDRPYRKAMSNTAAYRLITEEARGGWREPALVEVFIDLHRDGICQLAAS
jgi:response regulator RpfG family c-di-GMP phosphodiesterase